MFLFIPILENKWTLKGIQYMYALLNDKLVQTFTLCLDLLIWFRKKYQSTGQTITILKGMGTLQFIVKQREYMLSMS